MKDKFIKKWIITRDKKSSFVRYFAREILVLLEDWEDEDKINARCYFKDKMEIEYWFEKAGIYDKDVAFRKCREREKTKRFKEKMKIEKKYWVCECCGKKIYNEDDCTVDHIKPKSSFKNGEDMNDASWKKCWEEENLSILCRKCNQRKKSMGIGKNLKLNMISNQRCKKVRKEHGKVKNKIRYGLNAKDENALEIAKRDSNYIDVNAFFSKDKNK